MEDWKYYSKSIVFQNPFGFGQLLVSAMAPSTQTQKIEVLIMVGYREPEHSKKNLIYLIYGIPIRLLHTPLLNWAL